MPRSRRSKEGSDKFKTPTVFAQQNDQKPRLPHITWAKQQLRQMSLGWPFTGPQSTMYPEYKGQCCKVLYLSKEIPLIIYFFNKVENIERI